jgi:mono/diheme cytochrome c family protein
MKKCTGLGHWSMLKCVELEKQGKNGLPASIPMAEQYQSLMDLSKVRNPVLPDKKSIEQGKIVFYQYCFACHGIEGRGNGPQAEYLGRPVADLTDANVKKESNGTLFWKITEGNMPRPMPMFRSFLNKENIWDVINYIRTLPVEDKQKNS